MPKPKIEDSNSGLRKVITGDDRHGTNISYLPEFKPRNIKEAQAWLDRVSKTLNEHINAADGEAQRIYREYADSKIKKYVGIESQKELVNA